MTDLFAKVTLSYNLEPANAAGAEKLRKRFKPGDELMVTYKVPRNYRFLQKYFTLIDLVFQSQELYQDRDMFRDLISIGIGHCWLVQTKSGQFLKIPKSISFSGCSEEKFEDVYNRTVDFLLAEVIPGWDREDIETAILEFG